MRPWPSIGHSEAAADGVVAEARGYAAAGAASSRLVDRLQGPGGAGEEGLLEAAADLLTQAAGVPLAGPLLYTSPAPTRSPFAP